MSLTSLDGEHLTKWMTSSGDLAFQRLGYTASCIGFLLNAKYGAAIKGSVGLSWRGCPMRPHFSDFRPIQCPLKLSQAIVGWPFVAFEPPCVRRRPERD